MKHPFKANTFDTVAKEITVTSPRSELRIEIDYDDVDHTTVQNATPWYCERCDYRNDHTNQSCSACGEESPI